MAFGALGHQAFLEAVRELVGEESLPVKAPADARPPAPEDARLKLMEAGVQLLEALAAATANGADALPPETRRRGTAALQAILKNLGAEKT